MKVVLNFMSVKLVVVQKVTSTNRVNLIFINKGNINITVIIIAMVIINWMYFK